MAGRTALVVIDVQPGMLDSPWDGDGLSAAQIIAHHNEGLGGWFAAAMSADGSRFEEPAAK